MFWLHTHGQDAKEWFTKIHYPKGLVERMDRQHGFMTASGKLDCDHADKIAEFVSPSHRGIVLIPSGIKQECLRLLHRVFRITADSVGLPRADEFAEELNKPLLNLIARERV